MSWGGWGAKIGGMHSYPKMVILISFNRVHELTWWSAMIKVRYLVFTSARPGLDFKRWMPGLEDVHSAALQAPALCGGRQFHWVMGHTNLLISFNILLPIEQITVYEHCEEYGHPNDAKVQCLIFFDFARDTHRATRLQFCAIGQLLVFKQILFFQLARKD